DDNSDEAGFASTFGAALERSSTLRGDPGVKPLAVSDAGGSFELSLAARYARLGIALRVEGYTPILAQLEPGHEQQAHAQVFRLTRGAGLDGRVSDGNGHALAGLSVRVKAPADAPWPPVPGSAQAGARRAEWSTTT